MHLLNPFLNTFFRYLGKSSKKTPLDIYTFTSFEMSEIHCNVTANRAGQDYRSVKH